VSYDYTVDDTMDVFIADDFVLNDAADITMIWAAGLFSTGSGMTFLDVDSISFEIYGDSAGVPDGVPVHGAAPIWGLTLAPTDAQLTIVDDDVLLNLSAPISLTAGIYWLSFYTTQDTQGGTMRHYWWASETTNGFGGHIVNPLEGWGIGPDWTQVNTIPSLEAYYDFAFGVWAGPACCLDFCPTEEVHRCNGATGNEVWTCALQTNGCLDWEYLYTCTDPTPFCDDSSGNAMCVSQIPCDGLDLGSALGASVANGNNSGSTDDFLGSCGISGGLDECFLWTAPQTLSYLFDLSGSTYDEVLIIYSGITEIACSDSMDPGGESILLPMTQGEQIVIVVDAFGAVTGDYVLNITGILPEDVCDDWIDNDLDQLWDCSDPTNCSGTAGCSGGTTLAGGACTVNNDCASTIDDPACLLEAQGFYGGYCVEWCEPGVDDCPSGSICMGFGFPLRGMCADECDPAAPDCRADTWVEPGTGYNCSYVCNDLGSGQGFCAPLCLPPPVELAVDSGWTVGNNPTEEDQSLYYFTGVSGNTYYVWWDDDWEGSGTYSGDLEVSAYQENMSTAYFEQVDSGYNTSQPVTIVAGETTVFVLAEPYSGVGTGGFAIAVTSTNVRP
jgi:hypothetical protein